MNYIVCKDIEYFKKVGEYNYCSLEQMILPEIIAIDTEDTGLIARKDDMFCCQIGTGENNYLVVLYNNNYTFQELIPYIEGKILVGHNILFDLGFFYKYNFFPKEVRDTMLASKILYNGDVENIRHDFASCMTRELNITYDKTEQKNIHQVKLSVPSTIKYAFNDVDKLLELHDVLETKIYEGGFEETYKLHCRFIRALAYIEQCGLGISSKKWKEKMQKDEEAVKIWEAKIKDYIFTHLPKYREAQLDLFNPVNETTVLLSSPTQMLKVFKDFGIPVLDPKTQKESINENIISKSKHEFVETWLNYQEANHRVSTFGNNIYQQIENERIYTHFNPMVDTARLSTRKGSINFLNFPADKETRNCFVANEGNVMVVCDYSGQETVVAADLSGDEVMTDSVLHDSDLHCAFARVLFPEIKELSDDEIKEQHKEKRQASKSPRFAFQYGGSAFTIHQNQGIPLDKAQTIETAFKQLHSGLYQWGEQELNKAISQGYIESAAGWKLKLPEFKRFKALEEKIKSITRDQWTIYREGKQEYKKLQEDVNYKIKNRQAYEFYCNKKKDVSSFFKLKSEYQRLCLNNPVQSRGAHQLKLSVALFFEWIEKNNLLWEVLIDNIVHDEIVLECKAQYKNIVAQNLEKYMVQGGNYFLNNLKIKAEANIGESWGKAK